MDDWELLSDDNLVDLYDVTPTLTSNRLYHFHDDYFSPIHHPPIHFNPTAVNEEVIKLPIESTVVPPEKQAIPEAGGDVDTSDNQVSLTKETDQFVDMKMDSPKATIDAGAFHFEDQSDAVSETESGVGVNLWKLGFTGIGALCSFGVAAAATVCIIILGSHQKQTHHKAPFQIYDATDKRIKQVVHQATRLNEVISGTRGGVQLARAHISYGGYYDSV